MFKEQYTLDDLRAIMVKLRAPDGCPWDREQDHESLRRYLVEETYEVLDALDHGDRMKLADELGDVLLQIVFHAQIGAEENTFTMDDVLNFVCRKMVQRHPHVFGDVKADTSEEVLVNWEAIKKVEKGISSHTEALRDVPASLPALMRSYKVQQKAAKAGFDWDNPEDVFDKVEEELAELREAFRSGRQADMDEEAGDLLFSMVNLTRFLHVHPEMALGGTVNKFIRRFAFVEQAAVSSGRKLEDMTLAEMDGFWNEAKKAEKTES